MKILFITGSLNQGGAEYQILELAKLFKENGHEIEVFAITDYDFYKPFIEKNGIKYNHLHNHQSKIKRIILTIKKMRLVKPDLTISYLKVPSEIAVLAKLVTRSKTKLIVGERTSFIQPLFDKLHFTLMRFSNLITVNSIVRLNQLKKDYPKIESKLVFFPNIIDIEKFNIKEKPLMSNTIKIGFVGRISPEKNVANLIEAFAILYKERSDLQLLLFGDTRNVDYLRKLEALIEMHGLQKNISIKGKSTNIIETYRVIDILCLISDYEGFSNVISEALSCGLPVIISNIEENKFLIKDRENGFVVNHKDPKDIARGIKDYLNLNYESKLKIISANRSKAEILFDKNKIYNDYIEVINNCK